MHDSAKREEHGIATAQPETGVVPVKAVPTASRQRGTEMQSSCVCAIFALLVTQKATMTWWTYCNICYSLGFRL